METDSICTGVSNPKLSGLPSSVEVFADFGNPIFKPYVSETLNKTFCIAVEPVFIVFIKTIFGKVRFAKTGGRVALSKSISVDFASNSRFSEKSSGGLKF